MPLAYCEYTKGKTYLTYDESFAEVLKRRVHRAKHTRSRSVNTYIIPTCSEMSRKNFQKGIDFLELMMYNIFIGTQKVR